jgi:hypothetical protein
VLYVIASGASDFSLSAGFAIGLVLTLIPPALLAVPNLISA